METPASPHKPIIEVTALSRTFGRTRAIDQATFVVRPGENLCVIGKTARENRLFSTCWAA